MESQTPSGEANEEPVDEKGIVVAAFLIFSVDGFTDPIWKLSLKERPWSEAAVKAAEGLRGAISAATIPFQLEHDSTLQRHYNRFLMAERIRRRSGTDVENGITSEGEALASETASRRMKEFLESDEGKEMIPNDIVGGLYRHLQSNNILFASVEILYQAQVASWAIFESFCKSFIISWVNEHPSMSQDVLGLKRIQKLNGGRGLNIDSVSAHGFDLTNSMGDVIFSGVRLDGFEVLKDLCKLLLDDDDVQKAFGADLYFLNKSRHLIVHRRAEVDLEFISSTGKNYKVGEAMPIYSSDVERSFFAVRAAIVSILSAAERHKSKSKFHG